MRASSRFGAIYVVYVLWKHGETGYDRDIALHLTVPFDIWNWSGCSKVFGPLSTLIRIGKIVDPHHPGAATCVVPLNRLVRME